MAFQSEFADDDKLNACAINDSDHVGELFSPKGPWVLLIKKALNAWAKKQTPTVAELPVTDFFDKATGDRVALYKTRQSPPILNFAGKIDRVVGKKTVVALDKELPPKPAPTPPPTMSALGNIDRATSILWGQRAILRLTQTLNFLVAVQENGVAPTENAAEVAITLTALETHFHLSTATISVIDYIRQVLPIYFRTVQILQNSGEFFVNDTTSPEVAKGTPAHVPFGSGKVNFTPSFKKREGDQGFGDNCRAAMVLHEPVHIADHPAASDGANHVPEFVAKYNTQPAMNQLHNAHSYASFAQQVFFNGTDTRFGAGRPAD